MPFHDFTTSSPVFYSNLCFSRTECGKSNRLHGRFLVRCKAVLQLTQLIAGTGAGAPCTYATMCAQLGQEPTLHAAHTHTHIQNTPKKPMNMIEKKNHHRINNSTITAGGGGGGSGGSMRPSFVKNTYYRFKAQPKERRHYTPRWFSLLSLACGECWNSDARSNAAGQLAVVRNSTHTWFTTR